MTMFASEYRASEGDLLERNIDDCSCSEDGQDREELRLAMLTLCGPHRRAQPRLDLLVGGDAFVVGGQSHYGCLCVRKKAGLINCRSTYAEILSH